MPWKKSAIQGNERFHNAVETKSFPVLCIEWEGIGAGGKKVELQVILQPFTLRLHSVNGMLNEMTRLKVREYR